MPETVKPNFDMQELFAFLVSFIQDEKSELKSYSNRIGKLRITPKETWNEEQKQQLAELEAQWQS